MYGIGKLGYTALLRFCDFLAFRYFFASKPIESINLKVLNAFYEYFNIKQLKILQYLFWALHEMDLNPVWSHNKRYAYDTELLKKLFRANFI